MRERRKEMWTNISANIRRYRLERGLTQQKLAEMCDLSKNYYQRIDTGVSSCTLNTLIDIADALEIKLKDLFDFTDK